VSLLLLRSYMYVVFLFIVVYYFCKNVYFLLLPDAGTSHESEKPVLESLHFPDTGSPWPAGGRESPTCLVPCLLCDETYDCADTRETILTHILEMHKLVIADVNLIANFKRYRYSWCFVLSTGWLVKYW